MNGDLRAIRAADRTLGELNIDQSRPVDVYEALDRFGVFLAFRPLEGVLGVSLPRLDGVLITTLRGAAIQRFTAAHELGHCVLHDDAMIIDDELKIFGASPLERERQAQLFASAFLMPPDLAYSVAERHDIHPGRTDPVAVGRAARDMGVSYEATARRLVDLDRLANGDLQDLLRRRSRWRQDELFGVRPTKGARDVWGVRASTQTAQLTVTAGDEITILFPENRTTGFRWMDDPAGSHPARENVTVVGDVYRLPLSRELGDVIVGQQGERLISLMPSHPGSANIMWHLARPFNPDQIIARFEAQLEVLPQAAEQRKLQILETPLDAEPPKPPHRQGGGAE